MVSGVRPQVIGLLETWGDSAERSGDSNTVVMNGSVDFPKKKLAHQWPGSALGRPGDWGTASPGYSALPPELLLDEEPRRPGKGRRVSHRALGQPWAGLARGYLRR